MNNFHNLTATEASFAVCEESLQSQTGGGSGVIGGCVFISTV